MGRSKLNEGAEATVVASNYTGMMIGVSEGFSSESVLFASASGFAASRGLPGGLSGLSIDVGLSASTTGQLEIRQLETGQLETGQFRDRVSGAPISQEPLKIQQPSLLDSTRSLGQTQIRQIGNRQSNTFNGRAGNDMLRGRAGNDMLRGLAGNDQLYGEQGNDRLYGGLGNDRLYGGSGRNQLYGEQGNDQLVGGKDSDQLVGGSGDDSLHGGGGRDRLTGGLGRDRFILATKAKQVGEALEITDFRDGTDQLQLHGNLTVDDLLIRQGTGRLARHTLVQNQQTGEFLAVLWNVQSRDLDATDFGLSLSEPSLDPPTDPANPVNPINPVSPSDPGNPAPSPITPVTPIAPMAAIQSNTIKFTAQDNQATIAATSAARIQLGTQTIYIGTEQVSSLNQNPIVVSFDASNPANNWVRTNYEVTGTDGRGYGLFWSGRQLYALFSVDGTQGTPDQDFRRVSGGATQAWLRSYGSGGGAKVAVLAQLNPATGELTAAVYLSAVLSSGKSNSLAVTNLATNSAGNLVVNAQSYFAPRRPDGQAMTQIADDGSPFDYTLEITPDLKTVVSTAATGWI
jgi:hypothetical protein